MSASTDRKKELRRAYRERPPAAGVYRIQNTANGKALLGSRLRLDGALNSHRFSLSHGSHRNALLQREWNEYGAAAFTFEVLEVVKVKDEPGFDLDAELSLLEEIWIEQLRPTGDRGYNEDDRIRGV
jgi:hypothetical protein